MPSLSIFQTSLIIAGALALCTAAEAQVTGDLRGTIVDSSGAAVSGAAVTVKSRETGEQRQMTSNDEGRFASGLLRIGLYEVKASKAGFATANADADVRAGEIASLRLRLDPGQVTDTVTVNEAVSPIDIENAQIQYSVEGERVQELPVTRDLNIFAVTVPGTAPVSKHNTWLQSGSFNANGMRGRANNIMVDGITATDISTTGTSSNLGAINFSSVKEVKVITNNFSAEFGRNMGSQVQYLTKNGTNELHGELFEYFRNDKLNARSFFDTTGSPSVIRRNDFGFAVGGPVVLPKLDLRNKTFWHASYEGIQQRGASGAFIAQVPTPAMMASVTDPTSLALIQQYKVPTSSTGQLATTSPQTTRAYQTSIRVDQNLGSRDTLWGRYSRYTATDQDPSLSFISTNLPGFGAAVTSKPVQVTLAETHVFGASAVNEFRFGHGRNDAGYLIDNNYPIGPRIAFTSGEVDRLGVWEGYPQGRNQRTYQFTDTVSVTRARHNFKFGGEYDYMQMNSFLDSQTRGLYTFANWAGFAAGQPTRVQQKYGSTLRDFAVKNAFAFVQDDWKVTSSLTLNLGMRMEWAGSPIERNGMISNLNLNDQSPFGAAGSGPLGNLVVGQPSFHSNTNWGPRFGFAWSPGDKKTVIRGGYGIAYDFLFLNPIVNQRTLPPFIVTADQSGNFTGENTYARFIAGTAKLQSDTKATAGVFSPTAINFGAVSPAIDQGLRNPQAQQWNLGIQREVAGFVIKAAYVGTKGNYLQRSRDLNFIANPLAPAASVADETARLQSFKDAVTGLSGNVSKRSNRIDPRYNAVVLLDSSANSNYHSGQLEVQKRLSSLTISANYTYAKSIDNSSDALNNTLINDSSNMQDPRNFANNRAVSQFDLKHRVVLMHTWALPWGNRSSNKLIRLAAGGWSFSGITTFRSGFPVTLDAGARRGVNPPISVIGGGDTIRPNVAGPFTINWQPAGSAGAPSGVAKPDGFQDTSIYATGLGLSQPLLGNFGSLGRNTLRLNGERNFDWNFLKNFPIGEGRSFQVRGEFYNIFNNTSFQDVVRNITSPAFGQYTSVSQDSRNVQLAARFIF